MAAGVFSSPRELREVLDRLVAALDIDPEAGPALRSTGVPQRFVFPDADTTLDVSGSERAGHCLEWSFDAEDADVSPAIALEMDSDVANRFLQGRENLAIAMARGRIKVSCPHAKNALSLLPTNRMLVSGYRALIERSYPHLVLP